MHSSVTFMAARQVYAAGNVEKSWFSLVKKEEKLML